MSLLTKYSVAPEQLRRHMCSCTDTVQPCSSDHSVTLLQLHCTATFCVTKRFTLHILCMKLNLKHYMPDRSRPNAHLAHAHCTPPLLAKLQLLAIVRNTRKAEPYSKQNINTDVQQLHSDQPKMCTISNLPAWNITQSGRTQEYGSYYIFSTKETGACKKYCA